ncbi:MFS transporter [Pseudonocardia sp.]|uniref:MFS transporter n=1 Tax=Pseudonocardia sp. TaxID=60912 RepID=UPI003D0B45D3
MVSRWSVLAAGTFAQASTAAHFLGLAAVTPDLRAHFGLGLAGVGALIGAISVGIVTTLIAWGGLADRYGERWVMTAGLAGAAVLLTVTGFVHDPVAAGALLFLAGACGASVNAASGRAVLTWFPGRQRGLAMAVRQTSVPIGAGLAALTLPAIAAHGGIAAVFAALGALCAVAAVTVAMVVREPPGYDAPTTAARGRAASTGAGRRAGLRDVLTDRRLLRLSLAGALLVVPQFVGSTLLVEVLLAGGITAATAGLLLASTQVLGAAGRLANGWWSDRVGSRLGPLRIVAILTAVGFGVAALLQPGPGSVLAAVLVPAAALAISWNGLVFTAAGELAPPGRAATAMAVSNTANYVSAAATPALGGLVAQVAGWPAGLALAGAAAAAAVLALHRLAEPRTGFVTAVVPHRTDAGPHGTV